jgi:hypothetical protein
MAHVHFDKVVADVKALSPAQQQLLRALLDALLAPSASQLTEEEFERKLVDAGILSEVKLPITDFTPYQNRQPIKTTGKPLSEVILEERR